jgi:hypothetical protein
MKQQTRIISISGLSKALSVSRARVHQLVSSGAIVPDYVSTDDRGNAYYFSVSSVSRIVAEREARKKAGSTAK